MQACPTQEGAENAAAETRAADAIEFDYSANLDFGGISTQTVSAERWNHFPDARVVLSGHQCESLLMTHTSIANMIPSHALQGEARLSHT